MHGLPLRRPGLIVIRSSSFTVEKCWPGRTIASFAGNLGAKLAGHAGNPNLSFLSLRCRDDLKMGYVRTEISLSDT